MLSSVTGRAWGGTGRSAALAVLTALVVLTVLAAPAQAVTAPTVIATVPVGTDPLGVAVTPDGTRAYAANFDPAGHPSVSVISTATNTVTATIPVPAAPFDVATSPDGTQVAVAEGYSLNHTVTLISTATNTVTATVNPEPPGGIAQPTAVAYSPDGTRVYVMLSEDSFGTDNGIAVINTATGTVTGFYEDDNLGNNNTGDGGIAVSPDGSRLYVTDTGSGSIDVFSTATGTQTATVPDSSFPEGIALSPSGATAYVTNLRGSLSVLNTSTNTFTATIGGLTTAFGVAVSPDGSAVYASTSSGLSVIDTATNTIAATVPATTGIFGVAVNPAGSRIYVTNQSGNSVTVLGNVAAPAVTGLNPSSGPLAGGTSVTITGSGFTGATGVDFGTTPATAFTVNSDTQITATAPAAASVGPVDVTVTTPAGTSATSSADQYTYVYAFTGYQAPVDNPPTLNQVNAGQSIPMKFSLGGNFGLNIIAAGYPTSTQIDCSSGVPVNTGTLTDTAGGSGLQYDPGSGTYTYVWKTSKAWADTCQRFNLTLTDGTSHTANFQFK